MQTACSDVKSLELVTIDGLLSEMAFLALLWQGNGQCYGMSGGVT
tara:strand:+ start:1323 stop:1457 length:135 start_codon:yes stop_codon:yes gene_type:complete